MLLTDVSKVKKTGGEIFLTGSSLNIRKQDITKEETFQSSSFKLKRNDVYVMVKPDYNKSEDKRKLTRVKVKKLHYPVTLFGSPFSTSLYRRKTYV